MNDRKRLFHMVFIALVTAVISIVSPFSIPLPFSPVPLSLTTFILYLSVYILGTKYSLYASLLYLLLGAVGLPVFSGFGGGIGKLLGPSGGYLIGYLLIPFPAGLLIHKYKQRFLLHFLGMLSGTLACYVVGTLWLSFQLSQGIGTAFVIGTLPFLPGDLCKILLALILGPILQKRLANAGIFVPQER